MRKDLQAEERCLGRPKARIGRNARHALATLSLASLLCIHGNTALALGLGDITLHSALGQPLDADIQLIDTRGLDADDIRVSLASSEAFAKAGLERPFFLTELRFTPVIRGNDGVIRVQSNKPVAEPYLSFIVRLARNNGDQLHDYTLLLDPPNSPAGQAAVRSRAAQNQTAPQAANPPAPAKAPGVRPAADRSSTTAPASAPAPAPVARTATAIENQQLVKMVDELSAQNQLLQGQLGNRDRQIAELQSKVDGLMVAANPASAPAQETQTPPVSPVSSVATNEAPGQVPLQPRASAASAAQPTEVPASEPPPASPPARVPTPTVSMLDDSGSLLQILGAVAVLLLLLALAFSVRRNRLRGHLPEAAVAAPIATDVLVKPAQPTPVTPVFEVPPVAARSTPAAPSTPTNQRLAGAATDALDGASIYIAYGRFNEALAILRDAMAKEPERIDLRTRVLELLGETGDREGFDEQAGILREQGVAAETLQVIRERYPKLNVVEEPPRPPAPAVVPPPPVAAGSALPLAGAALATTPRHAETPPAQLDENAAMALNPEHEDDFQLNLDDLSMDADWDLVDPFDNGSSRKASDSPLADSIPETHFVSNLTELPEVMEMREEQFLSDFAEPEESLEVEPLPVVDTMDVDLDDAFLDNFMADDPHEFDLLELEEEPLSKINQAQLAIDDGDLDEARRLLNEVIEESDEEHQRTARTLLERLS